MRILRRTAGASVALATCPVFMTVALIMSLAIITPARPSHQVMLYSGPYGAGGTTSGGPAEELQILLNTYIDHSSEDPLHNVALLVEGPGFRYKGAAGLADGLSEPMTPDHKFKIASISKTFTAVVVLQMVEEGLLNLDDKLDRFFAASPVVRLDSLHIYEGVPYGPQITIEHLLRHTSGLNCYLAGDPRFIEYIIENPLTQWTPAMMLGKYYEYHLNRKAFFPPGESWQYTDTDYLLLSMIIQGVTGSTLHAEYRRRILDPLGLDDTYLEFYEVPRGDSPLSHAFYGSMDLYDNVNTSFEWGGGGIVSTCEDLNVFFRALLKGELFEEDRTLDLMLAATEREDHWNYGFGIRKMIINGRAFYGHPGAYNCDAYYCPEEDVSICLTINQMNGHDRKEEIRQKAMDLILGKAGPVAGSSDEVDRRVRSVEDGLRMPFIVEGYEEYGVMYNIYERMKYHRVPGVSISVINGGSVEWAKGYGELEVGTNRAVDTETLFQVASIGKPITATGVLRLAERGVLDLGKNVNTYLTSWEIPENELMDGVDVTLEMLLSHTGGVTVHGFPGYPRGASLPTLMQILEGLPPCNTEAVRVDIEPGTQWRYSGGGFVIVQKILEDLLGRSFQESMRQLVFEPTGMHRTFYFPSLPEALEENAARAHLADGSPVAGGYHIYPEFGAGAGLWSTPSDLACFVVGIQDSYMGRPGSLLGRDTAVDMLTPRIGPHGLGFMVTSKGGEVALSHAGGNLGYRNLLFAYAETGKGALIMTNSDAGGNICSEILRAIAVAYDWPDYQPEKKVPISLPRERLEVLAGHYDIPGSGPVPLMLDDGNLYVPDRRIEGGRILFLPESPTSFFSPSSGWLLDFVLDESGGVTGVDVQLDGMKLTGKRLR